jgi:hypothetical protein
MAKIPTPFFLGGKFSNRLGKLKMRFFFLKIHNTFLIKSAYFSFSFLANGGFEKLIFSYL